jgi:hypothetical protein
MFAKERQYFAPHHVFDPNPSCHGNNV